MLKHLLRAAAVSAAAAVVLASPAVAAAPVVTIKPATLPIGPAPRIAHISEGAVLDGDIRIPIDASHLDLLGQDGAAYIVSTYDEDTDAFTTLRVTESSQRVLVRGVSYWEQSLNENGRRLVVSYNGADGPYVRKVISTRTGDVIARKRFAHPLTVLTSYGDRVVLSGYPDRGTLIWNTATGRVREITGRWGYHADLTSDRLASFTRDPYEGGCTVVSKLSDPTVRLWRSCDDAVQSFSPDGSRQLTTFILSDGIGPGEVELRGIRGGLKATYRAQYFGRTHWETNRSLLLEAHGRHNWALVRCVLETCQRVSGLEPNEF